MPKKQQQKQAQIVNQPDSEKNTKPKNWNHLENQRKQKQRNILNFKNNMRVQIRNLKKER